MKKLLFVLTASIFMVSCSQEEKLITKLEDHLKQKLKDPSSYERINAKLDTVYVVDNLESSIKYLESSLQLNQSTLSILNYSDEPEAYNDYKNKVEMDKKMISELKEKQSKADPNEIFQIYGLFEYRAKNGFGALNVGTTKVWYNPEDDKILD